MVSASKLNFSWYNSHNVTIDFDGGLGNLLFQYASLYGIARASGLKPIIPASLSLRKIFPNLKAKLDTEAKNVVPSKFLEIKPGVFDSRTFSLNFMKNIKLFGFFQSWRYFDFTRNDVRRQFQFKIQTESEINNFLRLQLKSYASNHKLQQIEEKDIQFIGIHVRRGDYLNRLSEDKGYVTPDISYYGNAVKYFSKKFEHVLFIICTDDVEWSKDNIASLDQRIVISPFLSSKGAEFDLCLLSKCNHTIISVGTFGWWGAWLSGGVTIYYSKFARPESQLARMFNPGDYFIPQWIPM